MGVRRAGARLEGDSFFANYPLRVFFAGSGEDGIGRLWEMVLRLGEIALPSRPE